VLYRFGDLPILVLLLSKSRLCRGSIPSMQWGLFLPNPSSGRAARVHRYLGLRQSYGLGSSSHLQNADNMNEQSMLNIGLENGGDSSRDVQQYPEQTLEELGRRTSQDLETAARHAGLLKSGTCYLLFLRPTRWDVAYAMLGDWPNLVDVHAYLKTVGPDRLERHVEKIYDENGQVDPFKVHVSENGPGMFVSSGVDLLDHCGCAMMHGVNLKYARIGGTKEMIVGGASDCWKTVFNLERNDAAPLTLSQFTQALCQSILATLGPGALELPNFDAGEYCWICMDDICDCTSSTQPTTTPFEDALVDFKLCFDLVPGGLHLTAYRWKSSGCCDWTWWTVMDLIEMVGGYNTGVLAILEERNCDGWWADKQVLVGLTTCLVMGTIGDVQPTVEAALFANVEALVSNVPPPKTRVLELLTPVEGPHLQWHHLVAWDPTAAVALRVRSGAHTGSWRVPGKFILAHKPLCYKVSNGVVDFTAKTLAPAYIASDAEYTLTLGPGDTEPPIPNDVVVVTHPEHKDFVERKYPWAEFRPIPVPLHEFIALGQELVRIANLGSLGPGLRRMNKWILDAFRVFLSYTEQSDLVYVVSGAVVAPYLNSLYKGNKKIFEVCPVPRAEASQAPEFYLSCLFGELSLPPEVTRGIAKMLEITLAKGLTKRSGLNLTRDPPPRIQAAPRWVLDHYEVHGMSVPFKPWSRLVRRWERLTTCREAPGLKGWQDVVFTDRDACCGSGSGTWCQCKLSGMSEVPPGVLQAPANRQRLRPGYFRGKVYFSMGSCENLKQSTLEVIQELVNSDHEITVDGRWTHLFPASRVNVAPYREHGEFLADFDLVIHHGGAGVTYTCTEVGVWQMILYQVGDQVEWYKLLRTMGVLIKELTDDRWLRYTTPGCAQRGEPRGPTLASQSRLWVLHPPDVFPEVPRLPAKKIYDLALAEGFSPTGFHTNAYWELTNSMPPHHTPKFGKDELQNFGNRICSELDPGGDDQLKRVALAILAEVGLVRKRDILKNFPLMGLMTGSSHLKRFIASYSLLAKDWANHIIRFARAVGASMPIDESPGMTEAQVYPYLPTRFGFPTGLDTVPDILEFRREIACRHPPSGNAYVYLRPLFGRVAGVNFAPMHAVIEWKGKFVELQRVGDGRNLVVQWSTPQGAFLGSNWVKVIAVPVPQTFKLGYRDLAAQFDGNKYRSLGDNCLFMVNYIIHKSTSTIIPWKHLGGYGADIPTKVGAFFGEWVAGQWRGVKGDVKIELYQQTMETAFTKLVDLPNVDAKFGAMAAPKFHSYGKESYEAVAKFMRSTVVQQLAGSQTSMDNLNHLTWLATTKFRLTSGILHRSLAHSAVVGLKWTSEEYRLLITLGRRLEISLHNPLVDQLSAATVATRKWWGTKPRAKVVWAPLFSIHTPHHWLYTPKDGTFTTTMVASDRLKIQPGQRVVKLNLKEVLERYKEVFPEVNFPDVKMTRVHQGEYKLETKVPFRQRNPNLTPDFKQVVSELQAASGAEAGIFSMRFATPDMAEEITDRYFTGVETGFTTEEERQEMAEAIFASNPDKYRNTKLVAPEDVLHKWKTKYSAGFPYRFNARGKASRADLMKAAGGKKQFLDAVRAYIEQPDKFPSVSHVFVKDEVLPSSYKDKSKIRTVIAQDILSYFTQVAVEGDMAKRVNPMSGSSLGVSPQHGGMSKQAEAHLPFKHHYASDVTALDSRLCWDYYDVVTRLRKKGFEGHPQYTQICELLDVAAENLYCSWLVDIYTGRSRFKTQGASTGHATTTPTNTSYVEVMFLDAWRMQTKRPLAEFYEAVKLTNFADDNFYSTSLPRSVFGPEVLQDYLASKGVHVKLEAASDSLSDISFLAKWFSTKESDLLHVKEVIGHAPPVAIIHDKGRLVMKFSDCKGRSDLRTRWAKTVSLLDNCAHHPDLHAIAWRYLQDQLAPRLSKRQSGRKYMAQVRPRKYEDVLRLMYTGEGDSVPFDREGLSLRENLFTFWQGLKEDIVAWDGSVTASARLLERWAGMGAAFALKSEDKGADTSDFRRAHMDQEFIMERHLYVHAGMPGDLSTLRRLARQSPFSDFLRLEEFWQRRDEWIHSEDDIPSLNFGIGLLFLCYMFVVWVDHSATKIPILGPLYRAFTSLEAITAEFYGNLNSFYFTMFGCSSTSLGALIPKDRKSFQKHMALTLWGKFTHLIPEMDGPNLDGFQEVVNQWVGLVAMSHSLVMQGEFWVLMPTKEDPTAQVVSTAGEWEPLDHSDSVEKCQEILRQGGVPMVTSSTGAGKSTDFVVCLKRRYRTVYLSMPRRILVTTNPVAQTKVYSGSEERLQAGKINAVTHGYLELILTQLDKDEILVLDEFHELDEASILLLTKFQGQVVVLTATPPNYRRDLFTEVSLTKSRNAGFSVLEETKKEMRDIPTQVVLEVASHLGEKTMVILPSYRLCNVVASALERQCKGLTTCIVSKRTPNINPAANVYICTTIVDAGITIPGVTLVIDAGRSVGWKGGTFGTFYSNRATSEQRRGRTGRTVSGKYIRLTNRWDETKFDFTMAFACNNKDLAIDFGERRPLPAYDKLLSFLPGFYNPAVFNNDFSLVVFFYHLTNNRGDKEKTFEAYDRTRRNPLVGEDGYLMDAFGNPPLDKLETVIRKADAWNNSGENFINPTTGKLERLEFTPKDSLVGLVLKSGLVGANSVQKGASFEASQKWTQGMLYT